MGSGSTAVVASILFGGLAVWYAWRSVSGKDVPDRISNLLHLAMSGAMAAMPWSAVPALPQIVVFTAGAFWYAGIALYRPTADARLGVGHGAHGGTVGLWYHAAMLLAMVWMAVAGIPVGPDAASAGSTMTHGADAVPGAATGDAPWALALSIALGCGFAIAAVWLVVLLIRESVGAARGREVADLTASTAMAAGMAFSFLVLMS
jgi:hypothetical protein